MTAFNNKIYVVYCVSSVISKTSGIGTALAYTPGYIIVGEYFEKRKAFAMSLATFASGLGAMFPPVMLYLFEQYGFSGAFLIIAAISLHCCVGGMLYRPLIDNFRNRKTIHVEMRAIKASASNGSLTKSNEEGEKVMLQKLSKQGSVETVDSSHSNEEDTKPNQENKNELSENDTDRKKTTKATVTFYEDDADNTDG